RAEEHRADRWQNAPRRGCRLDRARRRYHRGRRQFFRRLYRRAPGGSRASRGGACRPPPCRRRGMPSRRHHSPFGHAGKIRYRSGIIKGFAMTASRRDELVALFKSARIVPVLTIQRVEDAVPLARALVSGGVRVLEVTLRTEVAVEAARAIIANVPDAIVGIGTILNADDLARAVELGALFGISPGATPDLLKAASASKLPFAPGIATACEVMAALSAGFDLVKFFPAEPAGGIKALRALGGPFPQAKFCPTGGVSETNAPAWLAEPNVVCVGGSWLC